MATECLDKTEFSQLTEKAKKYISSLEKKLQDSHDENKILTTHLDTKAKGYEQRVDALITELQNKTTNPTQQSPTVTIAANPSLNSSQPTFSGTKGEEVLAWINTTKTNLEIGMIDPKLHVTHASAYLRGSAQQDFITFKQTKADPTWIEFCDNLKTRFLPADFQLHLLSKILAMRCTGPLDEHIEKFQYLVNQTESLPEVAKIQYLINTLSGASREHLELRRHKTFKDAIDNITIFANSKRNLQTTTVETNYTENLQPKKFCTYCKHAGHIFQDCRKLKKRNDEKMSKQKQSPDRNFEAQKFNNFKKPYEASNGNNFKKPFDASHGNNFKRQFEAPSYNNFKPNQNRAQSKPYYKNNNLTIINDPNEYYEEEEVSTLETLFEFPQVNSFELTTTTATINGHKFPLAFDGGATQSVLPFRLVEKYKIPFTPSNIQCGLGNGTKGTIIGFTDKIETIIHGSVTYLRYMILPRHNVLIGVDWFNEAKAYVLHYNHTLVFDKRAIPLNSSINTLTPLPEEVLLASINTLGTEEDLGKANMDWNLVPTNVTFETIPELSTDENKTFQQLIKRNTDVFANSVKELKAPCTVTKFKIELSDTKPIRLPPYRKSVHENKIIQDEINKMLDANIIRPSQSAWSFPVLLIPKPDGSKRFCVDYRRLNSSTITDPYPLPRIDDIFDRLNGSKWFTALDLKSGYWQIEMEEQSIPMTAFSTAYGHYEFIRLPFGLKNAPSAFSRIMFQVLGDLPFVEIYIDDIVVHSLSFLLQIRHLLIVFTRLRTVRLYLNTEKCRWFQLQLKILGHLISENSIKMDPEKIKAISIWDKPKTIHNLQQFAGICGYYRRFIEQYAHGAKPIYDVMNGKTEWNDSTQAAFELLKKKLTSYPILRFPNFKAQFIVHTDASGFAVGAVLSQKDENGYEYVCAYASRMLKGAEIHYGITEKECLAVWWAIKEFRVYIHGTEFVVVTDHSALQWLMKLQNPQGRLARWILFLQTFQFTIIHRAGKKHVNADALSRYIQTIEPAHSSIKNLDPWEDETFLHFLKTNKYLPGSNKQECKRIQKEAQRYLFDNEKIFFIPDKDDTKKTLIVPKPDDRLHLVKTTHALGHFKEQTTLERLRATYFWKSMNHDVQRVIKTCLTCLRHDSARVHEHPALSLPVTEIHDRIGIDCVFGLPLTKEGFKGLLVITEYLTKYPHAVPIKSKTAAEIAQELFKYISIFGPPKEILSDQGREFLNEMVDTMLTLIGTDHRVTSAYHPRTNGLTERFNKTLVSTLKKHTEENTENWPQWIPYCLLAYRSRVHSSTGYTPFELMFGRQMGQFESWVSKPKENEEAELYKRCIQIRQKCETTVPKALEKISKSQSKQIKSQNTQHNITTNILQPGTKVFIKAQKLQAKLEADFSGPFTVIGQTKKGNYWLKNNEGKRIQQSYPLSRLKVVDSEVTEDTFVDYEEILKDRVRKGVKEYLVKWKGLPSNENSWVKESDFSSMEPIEEYKKSKTIPNNFIQINSIEQPTRITPSRTSWIRTILLLLLFLLIKPIQSLKITDSFKLCLINENSPQIDMTEACSFPNQSHNSHNGTYYLLERLSNTIFGPAIACKRDKITITTYKSLLGFTTSSRTIDAELLSREECLAMVISRKCLNQILTCFGDSCNSQEEPTVEYTWLSTNTFTSYHCQTHTRQLYSDSINTPIFAAASTPCLAKDLFCRINTLTIIWEPNVIHTCPFSLINKTTLFIDNNLAYNNNYLFQITGKHTECDMEIFDTTEGIYLTKNAEAMNKLEHSVDDVNTEHHLILADSDSKTFKLINKLQETSQKLFETSCFFLLSQLTQISNHNFFSFQINSNVTIITYKEDDLWIQPKCTEVSEIEFKENYESCFQDIPIFIQHENQKILAFLKPNQIISLTSTSSHCESRIIRILPRSNNKLIYDKNGIKLEKNSRTTIKLNLKRRIKNNSFNFTHSNEITHGFNLIKEIEKLTRSDEYAHLLETSKTNYNSTFSINSSLLDFSTTKSYFILFIALSILSLIIIIFCVIKKIKIKRAQKRNLNIEHSTNKTNRANDFELENRNTSRLNEILNSEISTQRLLATSI